MNRYLIKIAGILKTELGIPAEQKIPAQTLQVMKQVGPPQIRRAATGITNLEAKGMDNHPRSTSVLQQKIKRTL